MTEKSDKPYEAKFRSGGVQATVWKNTVEKDGRTYDNYSVSLERSYKDKQGEWQKTNSYHANDLANIQAVCRKAFDHIKVTCE